MFIKETITLKTTEEFNLNDSECEEIWLKLLIYNSEKIFGTMYRHPNFRFNKFQIYLESLKKKKNITFAMT